MITSTQAQDLAYDSLGVDLESIMLKINNQIKKYAKQGYSEVKIPILDLSKTMTVHDSEKYPQWVVVMIDRIKEKGYKVYINYDRQYMLQIIWGRKYGI